MRGVGVAVGSLLVACVPGEEPPPEGVELGPERPCEAPAAPFEELRPDAADRGLVRAPLRDVDFGLPPGYTAPLVVHDLDDDGDIDVLLGQFTGAPLLFENDGAGRFTDRGEPWAPLIDAYAGEATSFAAVDIDDDGLPDLTVIGTGFAVWARNLGGLEYGDPAPILAAPTDADRPNFAAQTWADADGDGDLDLALAGLSKLPPWPDEPEQRGVLPGTPDLVLRRDDGEAWTRVAELTPAGHGPGKAQVALFTDRDRDGDPDLFVPSDQADQGPDFPPSAFYDNAAMAFADAAPAQGADLPMSAMGVDSADLNGDGLPDYCLSDVGPPRCLLSGPDGYVESGAALGLTTSAPADITVWAAWSFELLDLDDDGRLDAATAGGEFEDTDREGDPVDDRDHPDVLWRGGDAGFVEAEVGFDDVDDHYGLAAADLDGDGGLEIVIAAPAGPPSVWSAGCRAGAHVEVRLAGPPGNRRGLGGLVEVTTDRTRSRELHGPRAQAQGPARLHFGVGDAEEAELRVVWPDGAVTEAVVPTRRLVTVHHPDSGTP